MGSYRHPITIEKLSADQDDYQDEEAEWEPVVDLQADVRTLSARERNLAQQVGHDITHEFKVRYYPGLDSKMRINMRNDMDNLGRIFHIKSLVDKDEAHFEIVMEGVEKT